MLTSASPHRAQPPPRTSWPVALVLCLVWTTIAMVHRKMASEAQANAAVWQSNAKMWRLLYEDERGREVSCREYVQTHNAVWHAAPHDRWGGVVPGQSMPVERGP